MLPVAAGAPQLSGSFIPEIWSGKLLIKFYESTVLADISNTDYDGEIKKQGDKVIIRTTPSITIHEDYNKHQDLVDETPESDPVELTIDRGQYWNFLVDDVDKYQSDINYIEDWATDASEQMKIKTDRRVLGEFYSDAAAANQGIAAGKDSRDINLGVTGSPVQITKSTILEQIVDMGTVLDEQNAPEDGRWIVLPPWACGLIKKSDLKDASLSGDGQSILRNGRLGMIDRFTIYSSNLLSVVTDGSTRAWNIPFGHKKALSFASQITETEKLRSELKFGWKVRGLNIYGFEVLKPEVLGWMYAKK